MNDKTNAIDKQEWNLLPEPSSSITDIELNEVTGGGANFDLIDKEKKIIYILCGGISGLNDPDYRRNKGNRYSQEIKEGYILAHIGGNMTWGHQVN
jgi:hypothetical protein